jgi:hypothetical protein
MSERTMSLGRKAMSPIPKSAEAAPTALAAAETTTRPAVPETMLEKAAAAARPTR